MPACSSWSRTRRTEAHRPLSISEITSREIEALRDETQVSAHLAIRDGRDVLHLNCVQTRSGFLSNVNVGARVPAHASPMGWLLLSDLPAEG